MSSAEAIGRIGLRPATGSGIGMALLASSTDEEIRDSFSGHDIPGYDSIDALLERLAAIRASGYARVEVNSDSPEAPGSPTHTVAVPVGNPVNSAIAISGWIPDNSVEEIVIALKKVSDEIGTAMVAKNK